MNHTILAGTIESATGIRYLASVRHAAGPRKIGSLSARFGLLLFAVLVLMPRGGIKIDELPITFSYTVLGLGALLSVPLATFRRLTKTHVLLYLATLPLVCISAYQFSLMTRFDRNWTIAYFTTVAAIPPIMLLALSSPIADCLRRYRKAIVGIVVATAAFGIADFVARNFLSMPLELPYVTVNAADVGLISKGKYNDRGNLIKLVSTYNNGNIFGTCMLMLGSLCLGLECGPFALAVIGVSIVLTLSRTAWLGLVLWPALWALLRHPKPLSFLIRIPVVLILAVIVIFAGLNLLHADLSFVLDSSFGGRILTLNRFVPSFGGKLQPFQGLPEVLYVGFADEFGLFAAALLLLWLVSPVAVSIRYWHVVTKSRLASAAACALILYVLLAGVDAAFLYIPVMSIYWMIVAVMLEELYRPSSVGTCFMGSWVTLTLTPIAGSSRGGRS